MNSGAGGLPRTRSIAGVARATAPQSQCKKKEASDKVRPEHVDAYVDNALKYVDGDVAYLLKSVKRHFGTEAQLSKRGELLASADERPENGSTARKEDGEKREPTFEEAVVEGIDNTLRFWGLAETVRRYGVAGGKSTRQLRRILEEDGRSVKAGDAAHHVVPRYDARFREAEEARRLLVDKFKIDLDTAANPVGLPSKAGVTEGAYHPALHTRKYYAAVRDLLRKVETRDQALQILRQIGQRLSEGSFPH